MISSVVSYGMLETFTNLYKGNIMRQINNPQVYMEPGTYYVGDLCYVLGNSWEEFCELTIGDRQVNDGGFRFKDGREFVSFTTLYGDGTYYDKEKRAYSVDAGLIGCIKHEDIDEGAALDILGGQVIKFDSPFICERVGGKLYFGKVVIDLDPCDEDEELY